MLYELNATDKDYPSNKTVYELFIEQSLKTPDNIAVVFEGNELTYQELDIRSSQLAHKILREYQHHTGEELKPDTLIALCVDRSLEMVIGILATLKAGAAYVPLDPEFPDERLNYILEDTNSRLLLTQNHHIDRLKQVIPSERNVCLLDISSYSSYEQELVSAPLTETTAKNLAYVIYTSGTTGRPKGVIQPHGNVHRLFSTTHYLFEFTNQDIWTLFHAYSFDFSIWEIFGALFYGGTLVIPTKDCTRDTENFLNLCYKYGVTVLNQTPSAFYSLIPHLFNCNLRLEFRYVIFGGEALNVNLLKDWWIYQSNNKVKTKLINMYGITETTVHVTYREINECENISSNIGTAIDDLKTYVLDTDLCPVKVGIIGELYIAGAGLARGYLNNPELTSERFITNPFATESDLAKGYTRMYKTGDLVRWLPDGNLEYIGRNDFQVKIRGYRIELGEIEKQLLTIDGINQAVVIAKKHNDTNNQYLVAYYVLNKLKYSALELTKELLLDRLSLVLPDYMLPSAFMELDSLPLTINGKLDSSALPDAEFISVENYVAPSNFVEHSICKVFCEVLGLDENKISVNDSFFALGGNSILAIKLVNILRNRLNIYVSALDIFQKKTIYNLANKSNDLLIDKGDYYEISHEADNNVKQIIFLIPGINEAFERHYLPLLDEFKKDTRYKIVMIKTKYLSIEDLDKAADDYSSLIIELLYANKCSQVNLCGFSAGGEIAYRICGKLKQQGFDSIKLIAIDSALSTS